MMRKTWRGSTTSPGWMANAVMFVMMIMGAGVLAYVISVDYLPALEGRRAQLQETPASLNAIEVRSSNVNNTTVYHVEVDFTYVIDGVDYHSTRLGFGKTKWPTGKRWAEGVVEDVSQREPFYVFVDLRYPERAALLDETSGVINPATYLLTAVGGVFFLLGTWSPFASLFCAIFSKR